LALLFDADIAMPARVVFKPSDSHIDSALGGSLQPIAGFSLVIGDPSGAIARSRTVMAKNSKCQRSLSFHLFPL
jgi:hypothetical protein